MKRPFDPDKEILNCCEYICNKHIQTIRYNKIYKTWYWDYPAMAAICHDDRCYNKRYSYSHYPQKGEYNQVLEQKLKQLGNVGERCKNPGCRYIIGNCAEQHAANNYMKYYNENILGNLYFTKAMRPRTKQIFDYCDNCKDTFPNI